MAPPIRTRPSFPLSQSLPSGSFHNPLILLHQREDRMKTTITEKLTNLITWTTALLISMKLWAMPCRATQDRSVTMEIFDKMWSTGEGNGKPLQSSCLENPMNSMKISIYQDQFSSVQFSLSIASDSLWPHGLQHARPPCPSPAPGVYQDNIWLTVSNKQPMDKWPPKTWSRAFPFFPLYYE